MMHMGSTEGNPKARFAGAHLPVWWAGSLSAAQSSSVLQRLAAPLNSPFLYPPDMSISATDRPGTLLHVPCTHCPRSPHTESDEHGCPASAITSSHPSFMGVVTPLSCVQV